MTPRWDGRGRFRFLASRLVSLPAAGAGWPEGGRLGWGADVAELATYLSFDQLRVAGEDWGAAIAYAVAAFHRPRVQQLVGWPRNCR